MAGQRCRPSLFSAGDAAALLWRMELLARPLCPPLPKWAAKPSACGPDAPDNGGLSRWGDVARRVMPYLGLHGSPLGDVHIAMALCGAGDTVARNAHVASVEAFAHSSIGGMSAAAGGTIEREKGEKRQRVMDAAEAASTVEAVSRILDGTHPASRNTGSRPRDSSSWISSIERSASFSTLSLPPSVVFGGDGNARHHHPTAIHGGGTSLHATAASLDARLTARAATLGAVRGVIAFWDGDSATAVTSLLESRPSWPLLGGSHAQRDVLEQTLIHAAAAAGELPLAKALLSERLAGGRLESPQSWYMLGSVRAAMGDYEAAMHARQRAGMLGLGQGGGGAHPRL